MGGERVETGRARAVAHQGAGRKGPCRRGDLGVGDA